MTATNAEGALTFRFSSDYAVNATGWKARVYCLGTTNPLEIEVFADPQTIIEGNTSQLSVYAFGGGGNYSYRWEPTDMVVDPEAQVTNTVALTSNQVYTVSVTDGEGNTASANIEITVIPDVNTAENQTSTVQVYPNPTNGLLNVSGNGTMHITVSNLLGQKMMETVIDGNTTLDLSHFESGMYLIRIETENGVTVLKINLRA